MRNKTSLDSSSTNGTQSGVRSQQASCANGVTDICRANFSRPLAAEKVVLYLLMFAHVLAVFQLIPPREVISNKPILGADHPVHAHRVFLYRQALRESGIPWGYDSTLNAGTVRGPASSAGAKPQEVVGVLFPFLSPARVVRLVLFAGALLFPLGLIFAAHRLSLPPSVRIWMLLVLLGPAWLYENFSGFFTWGVVAYAVSCYFAPVVLVLFLEFLDGPNWRRYFAASFSLAALFCLHILAIVVIAPVLLLWTLFSKSLSVRWRVTALLAPLIVIVLNAWWFVPVLFQLHQLEVLAVRAEVSGIEPDLTYTSIDQLLAVLTPLRVVAAIGGLSLAAIGLVAMKTSVGRRTAVAFGVAALIGLSLKCCGSFVPVFSRMQCARFLLAVLPLLAIPIAFGCHSISKKLRIPHWLGVSAVGVSLIVATMWSEKSSNASATHKRLNAVHRVIEGPIRFLGFPKSVPNVDVFDPLTDFVTTRTSPSDRLLVQSLIQSEQTIFPSLWGREVIGNAYPDEHPSDFHFSSLWGRPFDAWSPDEMRAVLERWGITWVFAHTDGACELMEKVARDRGEKVGVFTAFQVAAKASRLLIGDATVVAHVNRIDLKDVSDDDGVIVLRYRYHPGWECAEDVSIFRYPIPEDPAGFIGIRRPPANLTLRFNPLAVFRGAAPDS